MEEYLKGFDEFWSVYPRKVCKRAAFKAYNQALKVAPPDVILAGAMRYAQERNGRGDEFTRHASTWLNGECWNDKAKRNGGIIGALDRIEQYLADPDDNSGGPYDFFRLPPR